MNKVITLATLIGSAAAFTPVNNMVNSKFNRSFSNSKSFYSLPPLMPSIDTPRAETNTDDVFTHAKEHRHSQQEGKVEEVRDTPISGSIMLAKLLSGNTSPEILPLLRKKAGVDLNVPKTWLGLIKTYLTKGSGGFIVFSTLSTFIYRLSMIPESPFGFVDLLTIITTKIFWEATEWAIHSHWFHGTDDFRAISLFKSHDRHHDLPYYHVAVEPMRLTVVWWMVAACLCKITVVFVGVSSSTITTAFATYQVCAFLYSFIHSVLHSRIPFKKDSHWKILKSRHSKHHISPAHNLNIGPNSIDRLVGTESSTPRLNR